MSHYAIVVARFNEQVTTKLSAGALEAFAAAGVERDNIDVVPVPGAFELPFIAKQLAESEEYDAVVCLGAVIRGDTDHYDYVCQAATHGILQVGLETGVPVIFGVLTCDNEEQALARAGGVEGNKGADAARTAIEMVELLGEFG